MCSFLLAPVPFSHPLSHVKSVRTLFTNRKTRLDIMCKYSTMLLDVRYKKRENNKIATFGPNKVSVSP